MGNENAALAAIAKSLSAPIPDAIRKAFVSPGSATSGLAEYNLEEGARLIFPVTTILRNMLPRVKAGGGIQANWRSITAINPNGTAIGLSEGNRGGYNNYTEVDSFAKFIEAGMDDYVTWKAEAAANGFQNLDELAVQLLLESTMEAEEKMLLGGLSTWGLGATPTPTVAASASGGSIGAGTFLVTAVALTYDGARLSTVAGGVQIPYTRTNADGSTDVINGFSAAPSAAGTTGALTGSANSITSSCATLNGAFAYAWFVGASGAQTLQAITGINSVALTSLSTGGQNLTALPATDTSANGLNFDGLLSQAYKAGSGSYINSLATGTAGTGTALTNTGSGTGSIDQFDTAIESFFSNYRLIPTDIWISGADQAAIKALILKGNTNAAMFFQDNQGNIRAGARVRTYTNPIGFGQTDLNLRVHPFLPQGTVLFTTSKIPYRLSNVRNVMQVLLRRDYYSILWPLRSRKHEYGVYFDGVLQHYFPASMGIINNIAP